MDKTPRTDDLDLEILGSGTERYEAYRMMREFARTLERELSAENERDGGRLVHN